MKMVPLDLTLFINQKHMRECDVKRTYKYWLPYDNFICFFAILSAKRPQPVFKEFAHLIEHVTKQYLWNTSSYMLGGKETG